MLVYTTQHAFGCETWMLDLTLLEVLDSFQAEIGKRILKLHSNQSVRVAPLLCMALAS